jgi:hypothetical protein
MTPDRGGAGRRQRKRAGAHRKRRTNSALRRTVVVSGAVACIGMAVEAATPTADALSIVFTTPNADGSGNTVRINIFHGNIFNLQLGFLGNFSENSTTSDGGVVTRSNSILSRFTDFWDRDIVIGDAVTSSNTTEISIGSYNIFNPQASVFGGNVSNNRTVGNVATGKGNNTSTKATSTGGGFLGSFLPGMTGNGNTVQAAFFSGNIFNPQWSVFGANVSNNTAVTNVAANNGNGSGTAVASPGWLRLLGGMTGNGNTTQVAGVASNIYNQQTSLGGGNVSYNTAVTNASVRNGNGSVVTTPGGTTVLGTTGNGNTNQVAVGSSNISNDQINVGINTVGTVYTDRVITGEPWESGSSTVTVRTDNSALTNSGVAGGQQQSSGANAVSQVSSKSTNVGNPQQSSVSGASGGSSSATSGLGSLSTGSGSSATTSNVSTSNAGTAGKPGSENGSSGD